MNKEKQCSYDIPSSAPSISFSMLLPRSSPPPLSYSAAGWNCACWACTPGRLMPFSFRLSSLSSLSQSKSHRSIMDILSFYLPQWLLAPFHLSEEWSHHCHPLLSSPGSKFQVHLLFHEPPAGFHLNTQRLQTMAQPPVLLVQDRSQVQVCLGMIADTQPGPLTHPPRQVMLSGRALRTNFISLKAWKTQGYVCTQINHTYQESK